MNAGRFARGHPFWLPFLLLMLAGCGLFETRTPEAQTKVESETPQVFAMSGVGGACLGVYLEEVTSERVKELGLSEERGAIITKVVDGSPAEKAGLRTGDLIVRFDGRTIRNLEDFVFVLRGKRAGDEVEVVYRRGNAEHTVSAVLGVRP